MVDLTQVEIPEHLAREVADRQAASLGREEQGFVLRKSDPIGTVSFNQAVGCRIVEYDRLAKPYDLREVSAVIVPLQEKT